MVERSNTRWAVSIQAGIGKVVVLRVHTDQAINFGARSRRQFIIGDRADRFVPGHAPAERRHRDE